MPVGGANTQEIYLPLGAGQSDKGVVSGTPLAEGTVNFYPDFKGEGYLQSYAGRTDWFNRNTDPQTKPWLGIPPSTGTDITRIATFRDARNIEHIVFVQGSGLYDVVGNSAVLIYTFLGASYEGKYYPWFTTHEGKLLIANSGDPVLIWDGEESVNPLGVLEAPLPPDVRVSAAPNVGTIAVNTAPTAGVGGSMWRWVDLWWPQTPPISGPALAFGADGTTKQAYYSQLVVQFYDKYGNKGRVSAPTPVESVNHEYQVEDESGLGTTDTLSDYMVYDFTPPLQDAHIVGAIVGRTLSLNPDGGSGVEGVYHTEAIFQNTTETRGVCLLTGSALAGTPLLDTLVQPPPSASGIASWGQRVWVWGTDDPTVGWYSDLTFLGQFHGASTYKARDAWVVGVAAGDRFVVITRTSVEVLYESPEGIAVLQTDYDNGSSYARSFVNLGNQILGLFHKGFGLYDGQKFEWIETPYWLQELYLDNRAFVSSAMRWGNAYYVSIQKDHSSQKNNYLLMLDLESRQWYLLQESVYDLTVWRNALLGVDNSIYELFKGPWTFAPILRLREILPPGGTPNKQRSIVGVRILGEPSSSDSISVQLDGAPWVAGASVSQNSTAQPSLQTISRGANPLPTWDQAALRWDSVPPWTSPRDVWFTPELTGPVTAFVHDLRISWPAGHLVRLKALSLIYTAETEVRP